MNNRRRPVSTCSRMFQTEAPDRGGTRGLKNPTGLSRVLTKTFLEWSATKPVTSPWFYEVHSTAFLFARA
jgi:hypothetical protein